MATRRSRIKGIANIPQRRKTNAGNQDNVSLIKEENVQDELPNLKKEETFSESFSEGFKPCSESTIIVNAEKDQETNALIEAAVAETCGDAVSNVENSNESTSLVKGEEPSNVGALEKELKDAAESIKSILSEDVVPKRNNSIKILEIKKLPPPIEVLDNRVINDCENRPPPPTSPNKFLNRSRIKAIPRLGQQRRISITLGSASESEDEPRKSNNKRVRNDSVCSLASTVVETPAVDAVPKKKKTEFNTVIQRKCRRTEQSRKLAEARRDFQLKFNDGKPDRQKLTMIDLIFYNPATPPMSQKHPKRRMDSERSEQPNEENSEDVDNPQEPSSLAAQEKEELDEAGSNSDEENLVPAPQIKIGDDGEIIVDEKSLVVENKELKRERENLANSQLVDGDATTTYGIYNRVKRAKDWSKEETLRFYKVLNTIGTDFTLMGELFPERSRRELKMKFKKEERVNRALIDRAIMHPIAFDIEELKRELEELDFKKREMERLQKEKQARKQEKKQKEKEALLKKAKRAMERTSTPKVSTKRPTERPYKKIDLAKELKQGINSLINNDNVDWEDEQPLSALAGGPNEQSLNGTTNEIIACNDEGANRNLVVSVDMCQETSDGFTIEKCSEEMFSFEHHVSSNIHDHNYSIVLPSDETINNVMADISLSNIRDVSASNDCLILPFDDVDVAIINKEQNV